MSEAKRGAQRILGCYRITDAHDPAVYMTAVVAVLAMYPVDVIRAACEPATGIPSKIKWLPAIAEVKAECEAIYSAGRYAKEWESGAQKLAEDRMAIPDYRPKSLGVPQYTYGEYMEMTGWKGRPVGRFEIKADFAKEGESKTFVEPSTFIAEELKATDALLDALKRESEAA